MSLVRCDNPLGLCPWARTMSPLQDKYRTLLRWLREVPGAECFQVDSLQRCEIKMLFAFRVTLLFVLRQTLLTAQEVGGYKSIK